MHTVELLPDDAAEAAVRATWDRLAAAGLPSQARHPHPTNRPHLTLAVVEGMADADAVIEALPPLSLPALRLDGLLLLGRERRALAHGVVPSADLLAVQADVVSALVDVGAVPVPLSRPGAWVPHVTLARRLDPEACAAAVALLAGLGTLEGTWASARCYDTVTRTATPVPTA